jgi:hypothetical protein
MVHRGDTEHAEVSLPIPYIFLCVLSASAVKFFMRFSPRLRAEVLGEKISDGRTIAERHVVAHVIAAFEQ